MSSLTPAPNSAWPPCCATAPPSATGERPRRRADSRSAGVSSERTGARESKPWSACTPRSRCRTTRFARPGGCASELGTVLQIHLAEDGADVRDARERGYAGPLQRLMALGALPPGSILVHGVHLSADEVARASDAGCWFVQNPRSNRNNRVGYPLGLSSAVARGAGHRRLPVEYAGRGGRACGSVGRGRRTGRRDRRSTRRRLDAGRGATRHLPGAPGRRRRPAPVGRRPGGDRGRSAGAGLATLGEVVEQIRRHP